MRFKVYDIVCYNASGEFSVGVITTASIIGVEGKEHVQYKINDAWVLEENVTYNLGNAVKIQGEINEN